MLADPKYQRLNCCERSCWITLLCLASLNDGIVKHCEEQYLIGHSGIDPASSDFQKAHGILVKLEMLGMIHKGRDNAGIEFIVITNWAKRQTERPMTGYERLKKWRENKKNLPYDNELITTDNGKIREDKIRIDKKESSNDDNGKELTKAEREQRNREIANSIRGLGASKKI